MKPRLSRGNRWSERGAILPFAGIVILTLVGMTVVGVDLGRHAFTATEVQAVAEVAATGYARSWLNHLEDGSDSDATASSEALQVVQKNSIDGATATAANIDSYQRGIYDFDSTCVYPASCFTPGGNADDQNAVRATATATVDNLFAGLFNAPESTVVKTATAALTCGNRARTLPLAIGDCQFEEFEGPGDCSELETLTQQSVHLDNSCWTSLSTTDSANSADLAEYIRQICGIGGTTPPPPVSEGQSIRVSEGTHNDLCLVMQDCWNAGVKEFLVPIISCSESIACAAGGTNSLTVSGFASIELSEEPKCTGSTEPPCSTSNKCIPLHAFCDASPDVEGGGGTSEFGCLKVAMVE